MIDLKNIFEKRILKEPKVRSINGVFIAIDNTLERTNYKPSYQRNYVWDDEKATYLIESIFLGTEVPPIILFKSEKEDGFIDYEVIDGRQRYQSILRFINNELKLKKGGLQRLCNLSDFVGKTFSELSEKYQKLFKETKIRTIEYSFITSYNTDEEEAVKREIFQRYNSGITPLRTYEIDKAKYYYNDLNQALKDILNDESDFNDKATTVFRWEKLNVDQKAAKLRELLVLHRIPIKYYANKKQSIISKYFEYISTQLEDDKECLLESLKAKVNDLFVIEKTMLNEGIAYNRLYAECLFWSFSVMNQNEIEYNIINPDILSRLITYLKEHEPDFTTVKSSFNYVLVKRYETIAKFFENEYHCSFQLSIENNDDFKLTNKQLPTNISSSENTMESQSFEELRINKPEPTSVELTELLDNLKSSCFILRPSYQRADVKNKKKSSSIIESMLLGIMLPPIFVFKRKNGISEVVDGQQRLLSIISFIGETYKDEYGEFQKPLLYKFKLELGENAILKDLKGFSYSNLSKTDQNKIRKASIYIIEIKEERNEGFDPVDLFIRLNNKPYPIAGDTFEMWNSFAPRNIIDLTKTAAKNNERWFYFRKNNSRMDNENLYITLAYFQYMYMKYGIQPNNIAPDRTIEVYTIDKRIACRFRLRNDITRLMYHKNNNYLIEAVNRIEFDFVANLKRILSDSDSYSTINKELDSLLKVENGKRTQMSFYILWLLLHDMPNDVLRINREEVKKEISEICQMTGSNAGSTANMSNFFSKVKMFREKYSKPQHRVCLCINNIITTNIQFNTAEEVIILQRKPRIDYRFNAKTSKSEENIDSAIYIQLCRPGFRSRYLEAYLRSKLFYYFYVIGNCHLHTAMSIDNSMPFASLEQQDNVVKVLEYIDISESLQKNYFERLLDLMFYELYAPSAFADSSVYILEIVKKYPSLNSLADKDKFMKINEIYEEQTHTNSVIGMYMLKAIDIEVVNVIEKKIK